MPYRYLVFVMIVFSACRQSFKGDILIENVNVIDLESGTVNTGRDVVIQSNKISNIIAHSSGDVEAGVVIAGGGKYLMPGLWDMHVHMMRNAWYKSQMPLLRANGITGFREMWGDLRTVGRVRSMMQHDSLPFFRFVAPGHILDGKVPFWPGSLAVASPEAAIRVVDSLILAKADFIKVYSFLQQDVFQAIAKRCKEKSVPFAGHVPHVVQLSKASRDGMGSMEHLYGFLAEACNHSDSALALMRRSVEAFETGKNEERERIKRQFHELVLNNFSREKLIVICRDLKKNNTHIVPTLSTLRGIYFINDTNFTSDTRKKYMSRETLDYWEEVTENDLRQQSEIDWIQMRKRWALERDIMGILIAEGVAIMAGTDSDNPYAFPGFSLHDELAMYVELGMRPIDALRSATDVPVRFLNMYDSLGTVSEGKLADLVLLDDNPLQDIRNTTKITAVIANGQLYGRAYIDSVLSR